MSIEPAFTVVVEQDNRTGKWRTACPVCLHPVMAHTEHGAARGLIDHLNKDHHERVRGSA